MPEQEGDGESVEENAERAHPVIQDFTQDVSRVEVGKLCADDLQCAY